VPSSTVRISKAFNSPSEVGDSFRSPARSTDILSPPSGGSSVYDSDISAPVEAFDNDRVQPPFVGESGAAGENSEKGSFSMNVGLIAGIAAGVLILFFVLIYALLKYRSRDHVLARKMDAACGRGVLAGGAVRKSDYDAGQSMLSGNDGCSDAGAVMVANMALNGGGSNGGDGSSCKRKKKDVKEWYV